ncbi:hypothetical protein K435DRAFT_345683 [Dendrothele bispora CBS 962.96]|uniref:Uncharacterized protein n=1 Tax=Dendrothele bispora (strain CBS 962.96) TaxID=1314807 RepID=A0A4S8MIX7_DENBC|nr:hypothetical protein K435DRAFT_345683 [Dendrothele bispora CBS 962.96]
MRKEACRETLFDYAAHDQSMFNKGCKGETYIFVFKDILAESRSTGQAQHRTTNGQTALHVHMLIGCGTMSGGVLAERVCVVGRFKLVLGFSRCHCQCTRTKSNLVCLRIGRDRTFKARPQSNNVVYPWNTNRNMLVSLVCDAREVWVFRYNLVENFKVVFLDSGGRHESKWVREIG